MLVQLLRQDLDPLQLAAIGPEEAAVFRTPEGTAFVDVLAKKVQNQVTSKNVKDYDTLKWEEELRAQLAQKKGQTKKLTADEQAKVNAQLAKESATRHKVANVEIKLKRGIGIVHSLAKGPPTEAETWIGPAVHLLIECIREGAGLILGDAAALAYLDCADRVSPRLGTLRPFVGV
ncbi:translational activator of GCN4, partial [Cryomyces antarcticus]